MQIKVPFVYICNSQAGSVTFSLNSPATDNTIESQVLVFGKLVYLFMSLVASSVRLKHPVKLRGSSNCPKVHRPPWLFLFQFLDWTEFIMEAGFSLCQRKGSGIRKKCLPMKRRSSTS